MPDATTGRLERAVAGHVQRLLGRVLIGAAYLRCEVVDPIDLVGSCLQLGRHPRIEDGQLDRLEPFPMDQ